MSAPESQMTRGPGHPALPRTTLVETVEKTLTPLIGATMARSSVKLHLSKLGVTADSVTSAQVEQVVRQIGVALRVFVGISKADALTREVLQTLRGGGGDP